MRTATSPPYLLTKIINYEGKRQPFGIHINVELSLLFSKFKTAK